MMCPPVEQQKFLSQQAAQIALDYKASSRQHKRTCLTHRDMCSTCKSQWKNGKDALVSGAQLYCPQNISFTADSLMC